MNPPAPSPWSRRESWLAASMVALFVVLRAVLLDADPPLQLPQGRGPYELLREGAAKAHEARNWALEGVWQTNAADNYQFWRAQSPAWVYPLAGFFRAFGTGLVQLRIFSLLGAAIGFGGFIALAGRRLRGWPLWVAATFLAANFYYILYTRCGLLEPLVNTCWTLGVLALLAAWRRPLWLLPAQVCLVLAFLVKMTGALLAPLFAVATLVVLRDAHRRGERRAIGIVVVGMLLLAAGVAMHVTTDGFQRALAWNFGHYFGHGEGQQALDASAVEGVSLVDRLLDPKRYWLRGFALFPIMGLLGVVGLWDVGAAWRGGRREPWELVVAGWFLLAFLSVILGGDLGLRYRLVLFPPAALLAGMAMDGFTKDRTVSEIRQMMGAILALFLAVHGYWFVSWVSAPTYDVRNLNRRLAVEVGPRATVIGGWAPWLLFDSTARFYYVKNLFNRTPEAIQALGPTHLLLRPHRDAARNTLERAYPRVMRDLEPSLQVTVFGEPLMLYEAPRRW